MGKRKFEAALAQLPDTAEVNIRWRSFQLQPDLADQVGRSIYESLAESKGWSIEHSRRVHDQVATQASQVGLDYRFDRVVIANSFNAHRLVHLAATHGLGDEATERIFRAYFSEGEHTGDPETLVRLGQDIGLPESEIRSLLAGDGYADAVRADMAEAWSLGIHSVPFFLIDRARVVSGAQDPAVFLAALEKALQAKTGG